MLRNLELGTTKHILCTNDIIIYLFQLGNIKSCLDLLETLGVALDGITAHDVKEGNLKAILGLFFALSKYKQKQKQQQKSEGPKSRIPTDMKQSR